MTPQVQAGALGRALQTGMGVQAGAPSLAAPRLGAGAAVPALDTTKPRRVAPGAAMPPVVPGERIKLGGMELEMRPGMTDEEKFQRELEKYQKQQDIIESRKLAERDRANRGYFAVLKRANYFGEGLDDLTYEDVKDIDLEPTFKEYTQARQAQAALERAGILARAQAGRGTYVQGVVPGEDTPQLIFAPSGGGELKPTGVQAPPKEGSTRSEMATGLQGMGVARASSALNLLETNAKAMDKFEADLLANKASINFIQLELARKAMKGDAGSAAAEAALAKSGESGRALLRYVRGGKAIAGAVREITPRGGSNLMMQMETALSGIGPAGADPESVGQVQVFRNDLLTGVREGVNAMRSTQKPTGKTPQAPPQTTVKRPGGTEGQQRPPLSSFKRP